MLPYQKPEAWEDIDKILSRFSFWKNVYELWESYLAQSGFPQFDRWLAQQLKRKKSFGKTDRYWYSEILFAGFRFGYLAAFLEHLQKSFLKKKGKTSALRWLTIPELEQALADFGSHYSDSSAIKRFWIEMKSEKFFQWILLRYMVENSRDLEKNYQSISPSETSREIFLALQKAITENTDLIHQMVWSGVPLWFKPFLEERARQSNWDQETVHRFLSRQGHRPPLWLRLNKLEKENEIRQELQAHGFRVFQQGRALMVEGSKGIYELEVYKKGYLEIQDLASQLIGERVNPGSGEMIWDCCAGGGGKTLQIAASIPASKGAVYASDIREYKLITLRQRARRAQLFNIRTFRWDGNEAPIFGKEVQKRGGFHRVLVDAPCSSSGTWRRNPEARFRFQLVELAALMKLQLQLLQNASRTVIPKGQLIYATCSWLVDENEKVVENFLHTNQNFQFISQEILGHPYQNSDTMFAAVLERK